MKLRRDIASVPLRSGEASWAAITGLITGPDTVDGGQLTAAASIMAMLISDEIHSVEPLTLVGGSARVVLYCTFGSDALIMGDEIDPLPMNPTGGEWTLYVPCPESDLAWASETLSARAPRIVLHKPGAMPSGGEEATSASAKSFDIDWGALS
ncbi:hypothetical protein [Sphingomonas fennica]|nr:hypothetical protein [Sphingomonas fennica]